MNSSISASTKLGVAANSPNSLSVRAWMSVLRRVWINSGTHHLGLMAAGIAFYAFMSFVPLLGALVMSYGIFADPGDVARHVSVIMEIVPPDAAKLINDQILNLVATAADQKGVGLLIALGVSIYSATRASGAMIEALNVIYEEKDERGWLGGLIASTSLIIAAIVIAMMSMMAAALFGYAGLLFPALGELVSPIARSLTWAALAVLCTFTLGAMYRFAPDRADARWQWLSVGSVVGTALWLTATLLFGLYVANFASYDLTYGSLGAVVVLLMWLYVSAYSVLVGAMINAEAERQTARDTTTGYPLPMGSRGAVMADTSAALDQVSGQG